MRSPICASETKRRTRLGALGEQLASERLKAAGFSNISNLNEIMRNNAFADLIAERAGIRYALSVKTRNRLKDVGGLNASYNLLKTNSARQDLDRLMAHVAAVPAWVAVAINAEASTYSAYFGRVADLAGRFSIPMTLTACATYEVLAENMLDERITSDLTNARR